ncbi:MAG TPA: FAD/NAD(P)-binding protein, partial [Opitutaceae bacterium]
MTTKSGSPVRHIAIIGGGFSGTIAAVNLGRLSQSPLRVTLINRGYPAGRGIAYSTRRPEHLLNVVARNMSAFPDHPNHFVEWLRTRTDYMTIADGELRETFVPRRVYGDYLRATALPYLKPIDPSSRVLIEAIEDEALAVQSHAGGGRVVLAGG